MSKRLPKRTRNVMQRIEHSLSFLYLPLFFPTILFFVNTSWIKNRCDLISLVHHVEYPALLRLRTLFCLHMLCTFEWLDSLIICGLSLQLKRGDPVTEEEFDRSCVGCELRRIHRQADEVLRKCIHMFTNVSFSTLTACDWSWWEGELGNGLGGVFSL